MQYDMGKSEDDRQFRVQSHLNKPPGILLKAMKQLRSDHRFKKGKFLEYIREVTEKIKDLPELGPFQFPGREQDLLYKADYGHAGGKDCRKYDPQQIENRLPRVSDDPITHFGLIASGNTVMRSARHRDELRNAWNVLCFEVCRPYASSIYSFPYMSIIRTAGCVMELMVSELLTVVARI